MSRIDLEDLLSVSRQHSSSSAKQLPSLKARYVMRRETKIKCNKRFYTAKNKLQEHFTVQADGVRFLISRVLFRLIRSIVPFITRTSGELKKFIRRVLDGIFKPSSHKFRLNNARRGWNYALWLCGERYKIWSFC